MDGGLKICYIPKEYNKETKAKIEYRGVKEFPIDDNRKQTRYNKLRILEKKDLLRINKMQIMAAQGKAHNGITPGGVPYSMSHSTKIIALVEILTNPVELGLG